MRSPIVLAAAFLAGCASASSPIGIAKLTPAQIAAEPARWDGREVEVTGFMSWEFENFGLYESNDAYCDCSEKAAIYVEWPAVSGATKADNRRLVMVRGTFRNRVGVKQPNGQILISTGAPGPGPLEPGMVVRWLSDPLPPCR